MREWIDADVVIRLSELEQLAGHPLPAYRVTKRTPQWNVIDPKPTHCEHREDDLCPECSDLLDDLITDLPGIIEQLCVTLRKGSRFAPRGWAKGDEERPDEATIPWSIAASTLLDEINRFTSANNHSRAWQLGALSSIASRAHHIIDRPRDRHITICPRCSQTLWLDDKTAFTCPTTDCGYACDSWSSHIADLLATQPDVMLTMDELTLAIDAKPETIRKRIQRAVATKGMPRERRKVWRDGRIVEGPWVYRLTDVNHYTQDTA